MATNNAINANSTTPISLLIGGTGASLTASLGAIPYSTVSAIDFLAPGTLGQLFRSGGAGAPTWTTAIFPVTTTINQILYSSAANTITGLATANSGVLVTSSTGVPSILSAGTTGQMLQASSAGTPAFSTTTYPSTNAINTLLYASAANVMSALTTANNGTLITSSGGVPSISSTLPSAVQTNITALGSQSQALNMNSHLINNVTDPVSAQDAATKNYVDGKLSPSPYTYIFVYVSSTGGVDAVGNGSVLKPYATITYAVSQITDATISKRYFVQCYGVFTETSPTLKSFVYLFGNGSKLTCTNPLALDATFPAGGSAWIDGFGEFAGGMTLDFTSLALSGFYITNNKFATSNTITITGPSGSFFINGVISNNRGQVGTITLTVTNANTYINNNTLNTLTLSQTSSSASVSSSQLESNELFGLLTVSTTGTKSITVTGNGNAYSTLAISASSTGIPTFSGSGCGQFTAITLTGAPCVLKPDLLSVVPTFASGASITNVQFKSLSHSIKGTTTNDNSPTGGIGEYISSSILVGSAVSLTTATPANVTSISLTAGDWDVMGTVAFNPAGTTTISSIEGAISTTSATIPTIGAENNVTLLNTVITTGQGSAINVGQTRLSLSGTTTVYLVAQSAFAISTMGAYGFIGARRVR